MLIVQRLLITSLFILLSSCFSLDHENTWNQRQSSYSTKPDNCKGTIPIVVHWGAGWHTSIVIPNQGLLVSPLFKNFPFIEINWGDRGFYQAGASELQQKLAAPKAMLMPSESVMYFVGIPKKKQQWCDKYDSKVKLTEKDKLLLSDYGQSKYLDSINICSELKIDYGDLFQYYDARQIWITPRDYSAIIKKLNASINTDAMGKSIDLGNGFLFDSAYSTAGRFFQSSNSYFGLLYTCNSWSADLLGEIQSLKSIRNSSIYLSEPIFEFFEQEIKMGNSCVRKFE